MIGPRAPILMLTAMAALGAAALPRAAQAGIWIETTDAGQDGPAAAQMPTGVGSLDQIQGIVGNSGTGGNDADVFLIHITDVASFSAVTSGALDTMIWLFNLDGTGQVMNDDFIGFNAGLTNQGVFAPGLYYLGISRFGNRPLDAAENLVFGSVPWPGPLNNQIQPNPAAGPFDHWTGSTGATGGYQVDLTGVSFAPAPGAMMLLALAGVMPHRRRRRA